jgi:fructuronate reductase
VAGPVTAATLRRAGVAQLPAASRPRAPAGRPGIVHIGLGAFHRAHQAVFTEDAVAAAGGDWGIVAVAPRSPDVVEAINDQDGLFSVTTLEAGRPARARVVGSLVGARHLPSDPSVLTLLADPSIRVVTLTVTEKAYLIDPATGRLRDDPALRADLTRTDLPRTVPGLLIRALRLRAVGGGAPVAVVCCDNLPANGALLRGALEQAAGVDLTGWVSFPSTVVDRIVPASTPSTVERARNLLGVLDRAAVDAEPYSQWVLEDAFPGGRPAWERAGAVFTDEVALYERLKLRVLNGAHSTAAYLGALAGCATIADTVALPGMRAFLRQAMLVDILPTLRAPAGVRLEAYADEVLHRFANAAIAHRTKQVAMDGSQKLPQRILGTIADRRAVGAAPAYLATGLAAWIRYAAETPELDDPLAGPLRAAVAPTDPRAQVRGVFGLASVVPPALAADDELIALVADRLAALGRDGVARTLGGQP